MKWPKEASTLLVELQIAIAAKQSDVFLRHLEKLCSLELLARIVIDEDHCVSQWGYDRLSVGWWQPSVFKRQGTMLQRKQNERNLVQTATLPHNGIGRTSPRRKSSATRSNDRETVDLMEGDS